MNNKLSEMQPYAEWKALTSEERRYAEHSLLLRLDGRIALLEWQVGGLKSRKWIDRGAAGVGGVIGGVLAALGLKIGG